MSDSRGARGGAPERDGSRPIDVRAMPRVLQRIVVMVVRQEPWQLALAVLCSLGAAVATLMVPRLFGRAVDQAKSLLGAVSHEYYSRSLDDITSEYGWADADRAFNGAARKIRKEAERAS